MFPRVGTGTDETQKCPHQRVTQPGKSRGPGPEPGFVLSQGSPPEQRSGSRGFQAAPHTMRAYCNHTGAIFWEM